TGADDRRIYPRPVRADHALGSRGGAGYGAARDCLRPSRPGLACRRRAAADGARPMIERAPLGWPVRLVAWALLALMVLPFLVVIPVSLTDRPYLSFPQHGLSLDHYRTLIADPAWREAFGRSLIVATATTVLATLIGMTCAFGCWRLPAPVAKW